MVFTGTSSGFGTDLDTLALSRGDKVAATIRRPGALDDLKAAFGEKLDVFTLDVSDADAISNVFEAAYEKLGEIYVVVGNAGYGLFGGAEEVSDEELDLQLRTNLTGPIQLTRATISRLTVHRIGFFFEV